jgi:hypothetical protein
VARGKHHELNETMFGVLEPAGLLGICSSKPVVRLEYVVGVFDHTAIRENAEDCQITSGEGAYILEAEDNDRQNHIGNDLCRAAGRTAISRGACLIDS